MREAVPGIVLAVVISGCTPDEEQLFWTPPPDHAETSSSTGGSGACKPGRQIACDCPGGAPNGIQTCLPDGSGYGPCDGCGGQGGGGYSSATSSGSSSGDGGAGEAGSGGTGASGIGGQGGSGGSGGAEPECSTPADCPGLDGACAWRTCEDGVCGRELVPAGPLAEQTLGDCRELRCDGSGGELAVPAPDDLPDDGNECTADACAATGPIHEPLATGTACSTGLCPEGSPHYRSEIWRIDGHIESLHGRHMYDHWRHDHRTPELHGRRSEELRHASEKSSSLVGIYIGRRRPASLPHAPLVRATS
ncbi:uncharacterized protein SOCEGT47_057080 [Sorangium cellulosum]|uniref:Uncharacterized protein n=1 Tax=Sorangium cellulosum TaxID=56 RepID=A0A4P2Q6P1_SORCE|nr:uncharacterized protein SOCEGT47_057080 [Sorangium cellulosum]